MELCSRVDLDGCAWDGLGSRRLQLYCGCCASAADGKSVTCSYRFTVEETNYLDDPFLPRDARRAFRKPSDKDG